MKFKYVGQDGTFCPELIVFGIKKPYEYFKQGEVIDVPDDLDHVITSLKLTGLFIPIRYDNVKSTKKEKK